MHRRVVAMGLLGAVLAPSVAGAQRVSRMEGFGPDLQSLLRQARPFRVGSNAERVPVYLADPRCPFCHRTWMVLRPHVERGDFSLDVVMVAGLRGSEDVALSILAEPDPAAAWMAGRGSTAARVGPPPPHGSEERRRGLEILRANLEFMRRIAVAGTPWLGFVKGRDLHDLVGFGDVEGFVRVVMG